MESLKKIFNPSFYFILLAILITEILSFFGHFFLDIDHLIFAIVVIAALILSLINIKYGVWLIILELFIGSQGYLLHLDIDTIKISLRLSLWLIVMSVWFKNYIFSVFSHAYLNRSIFTSTKIFKTAFFPYFLILFFFIVVGIISGYFHGNAFQNIFLDANGWFYFLLFFPFCESFFNPGIAGPKPFTALWRLLAVATTWLCLKTFFIFFFIGHPFPESNLLHLLFTHELYQWTRDTLVGEITTTPLGFIRVFIQSQVFVMISLFAGLFYTSIYWSSLKQSKKTIIFLMVAGALMTGTIFISYSRSFWLASAAVFIFYAYWAIFKLNWKIFLKVFVTLLASIILGLLLVIGLAKFPVPPPSFDLDITQTIVSRTGNTKNDVAISSRSALLPILWQRIISNPIIGSGFGTTLSYRSSDYRAVQSSNGGLYTTYAFEWGWLDIWLKIGFLGLMAYILLFSQIIKEGIDRNSYISYATTAGLLLIIIISVFSPYTNHPLGIGFLIIAAALIYNEKNNSCACA